MLSSDIRPDVSVIVRHIGIVTRLVKTRVEGTDCEYFRKWGRGSMQRQCHTTGKKIGLRACFKNQNTTADIFSNALYMHHETSSKPQSQADCDTRMKYRQDCPSFA